MPFADAGETIAKSSRKPQIDVVLNPALREAAESIAQSKGWPTKPGEYR